MEAMASSEKEGKAETYHPGFRIHVSGQSVDTNDMGGFVVPRTIFSPVGRRDFLPWVIKGAIGFKDLHPFEMLWSATNMQQPSGFLE